MVHPIALCAARCLQARQAGGGGSLPFAEGPAWARRYEKEKPPSPPEYPSSTVSYESIEVTDR